MSPVKRLARREFDATAPERARHFQGKYFFLAARPDSAGGGAKYSCVVSKKIAKKAVDRNTAKRKCRTAVVSALRSCDKSFVFIFRIKPPALSAPYKDLRQEIAWLIGKAIEYRT